MGFSPPVCARLGACLCVLGGCCDGAGLFDRLPIAPIDRVPLTPIQP
jgi:hypothetical protein